MTKVKEKKEIRMEKKGKKLKVLGVILIVLFVLLGMCIVIIRGNGFRGKEESVLKIAVPYDSTYTEFGDSYYVEWLEEESGYQIEIEYISETYTTDYLTMLFSSTVSDVDAVFFSNNNAPTAEELEYYIECDYLLALNEYIEEGSNIGEVIEDFSDYNLKNVLQNEDGNIYYMPSLTLSETQCYLQTAWMNVEWLEELGLSIPTNTEELKIVLQAFVDMDDNAVPLIGSMETENTFVCNFLMNSFTTCDPFNYYFALDNQGEIYYPPTTQEWREGLQYCNELYEEGLLVEENFTFNEDELYAICNDPLNVVGMFLAKEIEDVIYDESPQLLSYFLVVPPLNDVGTVTLEAQLPEVGGIVLQASNHQKEAFEVLDLMCSEEAYLISHFGEYQVDWEYSSSSDISVLGYPAEITMISSNMLKRNPSDATVLGPYITDVYTADRVAWVGYQVNQSEYLQARAYRTYQNYEPEYILDFIAYTDNDIEIEEFERLASYIKSNMVEFIRGTKEVSDEEVWQEYLDGIEKAGTYIWE
ncbi:MAG: hypothetical protein R3Y67_10075 [Eubacteriales bacterium]